MLELNKIHCGDCLELMKSIPDKSIDLVLTDPPYGIGIAKNGTVGGCSSGGYNKGFNGPSDYGVTNRDNAIPSKEYFDEIFRISKNQIIWGGNYFIEYLHNSRCWIFRDKKIDDRQGSNFADGELAWTSFDKNVRKFIFPTIGFDGLNNPQKEDKLHPTQKPVPLFKRILENYSEPGMTILDPFLGSGTTAIACKQMGRNFIGIEKEQKYVDIANKRLQYSQVGLF